MDREAAWTIPLDIAALREARTGLCSRRKSARPPTLPREALPSEPAKRFARKTGRYMPRSIRRPRPPPQTGEEDFQLAQAKPYCDGRRRKRPWLRNPRPVPGQVLPDRSSSSRVSKMPPRLWTAPDTRSNSNDTHHNFGMFRPAAAASNSSRRKTRCNAYPGTEMRI